MLPSIILVSMRADRYRFGGRTVGFTWMIRAGGFNGIAVTSWAGGYPRKTSVKFNAGRRFDDTSCRSRKTVNQAIHFAGRVSVRLYCIGPTIVAKYDTFQDAVDSPFPDENLTLVYLRGWMGLHLWLLPSGFNP